MSKNEILTINEAQKIISLLSLKLCPFFTQKQNAEIFKNIQE